MKLLVCLIVFCLKLNLGFCQISIQPIVPTVGLIQKEQLWNLLVVNSTTSALEAKVELVLRDRRNGNDVMVATTSDINIPLGSRQLNVNTVGVVEYNYFNTNTNFNVNGFLPIGSYTACYNILTGEGRNQLAATECIQFDVEPLSPPMLTFPADSNVLDIDPKQFSWLPPNPPNLFTDLTYDVLVAEVLDGQQPEEAIQNNLPVIFESGVRFNLYTRSTLFNTLEPEKWYAWQVIARDRDQFAGKSETWVFSYNISWPLSSPVKSTPFVLLKRDNPEQAIAPDGYLKFAYHNRLNDSTAIVIIDEMGSVNSKRTSKQFTVSLRRGDNQIQYLLTKVMKPDIDKVYKATLLNSIGEKWVLVFKVKYFKG